MARQLLRGSKLQGQLASWRMEMAPYPWVSLQSRACPAGLPRKQQLRQQLGMLEEGGQPHLGRREDHKVHLVPHLLDTAGPTTQLEKSKLPTKDILVP